MQPFENHRPPDPCLGRMIEALDLEVAAIRERGSSIRLRLHGGERIGTADRQTLYRFPLTEELELRDETPIRLRVDGQEVNGTIVSVREGVIVIALDEDLGDRIASARLVADDSFLVERLKLKLQEVAAGRVQFNRAAADRVIGEAAIRSGTADPRPEVLSPEISSDKGKLQAVRLSLGSDTLFLWGPPGTGKTTTVARIVEAHYREGRSVLVVSNTNIAVDTALEMVAERLESEPDFQKGAVLRFGPVQSDSLKNRYGSQVILENVLARLSEDLVRRLRELEERSAIVQAESERLESLLQRYEALEGLRGEYAEARNRHTAANQQAAELARRGAALEAQLQWLRADLERAQRMGPVRRFLAGLDRDRLILQIGHTVAEARATRDAEAAARRAAAEAAASLQAIARRVDALQRELAGQLPRDDCVRLKASADRELDDLHEEIAGLRRQLDALRERLLRECRVLATTAYRVYLYAELQREWDVVVIDEASMLILPLSYYVAGLARSVVVVAGDFRQLPPVVVSREQLAREWLKRDVFEKAGIVAQVDDETEVPYLAKLSVQFRMREPICELVSEHFYRRRLTTDRQVCARECPPFLGTTVPLLYVDTSSLHPWAAMPLDGFSRYNLLHALVIRGLLACLEEEGYWADDQRTNNIGVVTPFKAQTRLLQRLAAERFGERARGLAATVHRFQGKEKDGIVFDLTESYGARASHFLRAKDTREDGVRLLNVGLSRARDYVVLVGNFEYVMRNGGPVVQEVVSWFRDRGEPLDAKKLLEASGPDWIDALSSLHPPSVTLPESATGLFNEATFYPAFAEDLRRASRSVVILAPYITENGVGRWADHFHAAIARGVSIRVTSRPPSQQPPGMAGNAEELFDKLLELGVAVDYRARMHEKLAIIDEGIVWHGSLNILSHRNTHESMMRIPSPALAEQLLRFLSPFSGAAGQEERAAPGNPPCPDCQRPTILDRGRYGPFFRCSSCGATLDPRRLRRANADQRQGRLRRQASAGGRRWRNRSAGGGAIGAACPMPGCGGRLERRHGRFGAFLGCSNFPDCRYTENL